MGATNLLFQRNAETSRIPRYGVLRDFCHEINIGVLTIGFDCRDGPLEALPDKYHDGTVTEKPRRYWRNREEGYELHAPVHNDRYTFEWDEVNSTLDFSVVTCSKTATTSSIPSSSR